MIPGWAEVVFGFDPDEGGGAFEVAATVAALVGTISFMVAARFEWRRGGVAVEAER
jgi:hypothetical protein